MIIFLYGVDTCRSRQHLKKIMEKFRREKDLAGLNVVRLDCGQEGAVEGVLGEILAVPFLAERRMVVIENVLASKQKELLAELLRRVEEKKLSESNVVVFWESGETFKTKEAKALFERLAAEKFCQKFDVLTGAKLAGYLSGEVAERGGRMGAAALRFLGEHGGDMWRLQSLLDQLIAYKAGGEIGVKDVALFLDEKADDNIFSLVDAVVGRQGRQALAMIAEQYRLGEEPQYIFSMLVRQFRILLEMRDMFERGEDVSSEIIAKKLQLHPFVVKKSLPTAKRYTAARLRAIYRQLFEMEAAIKTGRGEAGFLLDVFVGRMMLEMQNPPPIRGR